MRAYSSSEDLILILVAIFIPPLAVGLVRGCGGHVFLNILLCLLLGLPAVIHAVLIVLASDNRRPPPKPFDASGGYGSGGGGPPG